MTLSYNPHTPSFLTEGVPFEQLARLRKEVPVAPTPTGAWYLSRREDIERVLKDVDGFYADLGPMTGLAGVEVIPEEEWFLSEIPEPRHARLRRLFNASFGPHRTRTISPYIKAVCNSLIDSMLEREVIDLHAEYALPIPSLVMAHVLDLDEAASDLFMKWSFDGSLLTRPSSPGVAPDRPAVQEFFQTLLDEQRALPEPTNHVAALFLGEEIDGEKIPDQQIVTQLHFMIQAGVHTTRGLLVHVLQRLLEDRSLFEQMRDDQERIAVLVEEVLRHDAPVQRVTRRCAHATTIGGVEMNTGEWLEVGLASANRDESHYEDSERFSLDRPDPKDHFGFGGGPHVCPGATLARAEAVMAAATLVERIETMEMLDGATYPPIPGSLSHAPVYARLNPR